MDQDLQDFEDTENVFVLNVMFICRYILSNKLTYSLAIWHYNFNSSRLLDSLFHDTVAYPYCRNNGSAQSGHPSYQVSNFIIYPINQNNHKNHSSDRKCTLRLLAYFVCSPLFSSISFLKKGQYFYFSLNLGFLLEQISLISLKSKKFKDEIF